MSLSLHFSRYEFACKCGCGFDTVDVELLRILEIERTHYGKPITITSGCRCPAHNKKTGGSPNSQHLYAKAADFIVEGVPADKVFKRLNSLYPDKYGLGEYSTWTHADSRDLPSRW